MMLDPPGLREKLREFPLPSGHWRTRLIKQDSPGTGSTLIERENKWHGSS